MNNSSNNQVKGLRVYYSHISQCLVKDAKGHRRSSLLKDWHSCSLFLHSTKSLFMLFVICSTDLNSAHLIALTTSAALKNDITSSTNIHTHTPSTQALCHCSAVLFNLQLSFLAERNICGMCSHEMVLLNTTQPI